jgi:hypothetical protein
MDSHDRYVLAIAMLDGDRDARKILADLLEEQGERGLAQWARGGSNQKHRRLDLALMLLPCRAAISLAVDFVEHAFPSRADKTLFGPLAERVKQWHLSEFSDAAMASYGQRWIADMPYGWGIRPRGMRNTGVRNANLKAAIESLVAAVTCAVNAELATHGAAPSGTPRHWESMTLLHLRAVARASQNQALPVRSATAATAAPTEIVWQIEQTKTQLQQLLAGDRTWPK